MEIVKATKSPRKRRYTLHEHVANNDDTRPKNPFSLSRLKTFHYIPSASVDQPIVSTEMETSFLPNIDMTMPDDSNHEANTSNIQIDDKQPNESLISNPTVTPTLNLANFSSERTPLFVRIAFRRLH
jgi:hypothetical protein